MSDPAGDVDPPPVFRTWRGAYAFVLGVLAALIAAFWLFSALFS